ncbi:lytic polysaccharide monooxygenase [Pseudocitrobacter cyperus]|uniref:Lytic polysaccharide monooxygenase n=1 Tax=Pseudocitrobacter cyperus TaxID=3112843 RepID=A0ABV0HEI9_9ENTR
MNKTVLLLAGMACTLSVPVHAEDTKGIEIKHGATLNPIARQLQCKNDGHFESPPDGAGIPNAACKNAYLFVPDLEPWQRNQMFNEWPAYSQNLNGADPKDKVPDGALCAGGKDGSDTGNPQNFTGIDQPHKDWHVSTVVVKDGIASLTYDATQVHEPSLWKIYLAKPTFNAHTDILKWADLDELDKPDVIVPPEQQAKNKKNNYRYPGIYEVKVKIPEARVNDQQTLLYVVWERDEGPHETFFSCSDVKFSKG